MDAHPRTLPVLMVTYQSKTSHPTMTSNPHVAHLPYTTTPQSSLPNKPRSSLTLPRSNTPLVYIYSST